MSIDIIIVAKGMWNTTRTCLDSLCSTIGSEIKIIYIDNGTPEGENSYEQFLAWAEENVNKGTVVGYYSSKEERPLNLAAAWNKGLENSTAELILVLNNDLIFREAGWWDEFEAALSDPTIGIVGLNGLSWANVPFIQGSCFAFTRDTLAKVGMFDPRFEFTTEDVDYSKRIQDIGLSIRSFEHLRPKIEHLEGATRNHYAGETKHYLELAHISRIRFCYKHSIFPPRIED